MRAVIADDVKGCRDVLQVILRSEGVDVVGVAMNGAAAVELCRIHRPDLVILDVSMPPHNGDLAARDIRAGNLAKHIVLASNLANDAIMQAMRLVGAIRCTKPYKRDMLAKIVASLR